MNDELKEVRHNIMNGIMNLKYVEQDSILDVLDDYLNPYIEKLEKESIDLKKKYVKNITDCDICDTYCNSRLNEAIKIIQDLLECLKQDTNDPQTNYYICQYMDKAEKFIKE